VEVTEGLPLARLEALVAGEGVQRTTAHQVEVEGILGEEAAPIQTKQEGEAVRTAVVVIVILVCPTGIETKEIL